MIEGSREKTYRKTGAGNKGKKKASSLHTLQVQHTHHSPTHRTSTSAALCVSRRQFPRPEGVRGNAPSPDRHTHWTDCRAENNAKKPCARWSLHAGCTTAVSDESVSFPRLITTYVWTTPAVAVFWVSGRGAPPPVWLGAGLPPSPRLAPSASVSGARDSLFIRFS